MKLYKILYKLNLWFLLILGMVLLGCRSTEAESTKFDIAELRQQLIKTNKLKNNARVYCNWQSGISSNISWIYKTDKNEILDSLIVAGNINTFFDISPIKYFKEPFNSLTLISREVNLRTLSPLPSILVLKKLNKKSLLTLPKNKTVKSLYLYKTGEGLSFAVQQCKKLKSLAIVNYSGSIFLTEQMASELKKIYIRKGTFTNIMVSKNIGLHSIRLDHFRLDNIEFLKGLAIEELRIEHSKISDFSLIAMLPNLKRLYITDSPLNDISFLKGKKLDILDIRNTPVAPKKLPSWLEVKKLIK